MIYTLDKRRVSALMGTGLGDAWGYPWEFARDRSEETYLSVNDDNCLVISDDTQMTLALVRAMNLIESEEIDDVATMEYYIAEEFLKYGFDSDNNRAPGTTVMTSLTKLQRCGDHNQWRETSSTFSDGCGSVMRAIPAILARNESTRMGLAVRQGQITHNSPHARAATAILAHTVLSAIESPEANFLRLAQTTSTSALIDNDIILNDGEKQTLRNDIDINAKIRLNHGVTLTMSQAIDRSLSAVEYCNSVLDKGGVNALAMDNSVVKTVGNAFDGASAVLTALILAELYRTRTDVTLEDILYISVQWDGDRDSRAAVLGAILGAVYAVHWELLDYEKFEPRYDNAIRSYTWGGFDEVDIAAHYSNRKVSAFGPIETQGFYDFDGSGDTWDIPSDEELLDIGNSDLAIIDWSEYDDSEGSLND